MKRAWKPRSDTWWKAKKERDSNSVSPNDDASPTQITIASIEA